MNVVTFAFTLPLIDVISRKHNLSSLDAARGLERKFAERLKPAGLPLRLRMNLRNAQ